MTATTPQHLSAFGKKSDSYDAHAIVQKDAAAWLAEWLPKDSGSDACLEFGCGTGLFTKHLIDHFIQVEATDLETKMVAKCRQRLPQVNVKVRDAWSVQNDPTPWDFIASSSLLHWAGDPVNTLRNWAALLRKNGRMIIGFFIEPSLPEMCHVIGAERGPVQWRSHNDWNAIYDAAGFKVIRTECKTRRYEYDSPLHFWKSLHGTGAAVSQHMRPSQMLRFFREYESAYHCEKGVYATWTYCRTELLKP